jgi:PiT family inorganic phosphate transporter
MLPMMVAESNRHRASGRENGTTAATWEIVNGIKYLRCHRTVIVQPYKLQGTPQGQDQDQQLKKQLDNATKFIPTWVKVAVAIALGLGCRT